MAFNPGIKVGAELTSKEISTIFQCSNMGKMRRSEKTGTLVIISDYTKRLYRDVWKNGVLHYKGMGKTGNQELEGNQNGTLYYSRTNGVEVHLFEIMERSTYTYRGVVELVEQPYKTLQLDGNGRMRNVWMFPVKPARGKYIFDRNDAKDNVRLQSITEQNQRKLARLLSYDKGLRRR